MQSRSDEGVTFETRADPVLCKNLTDGLQAFNASHLPQEVEAQPLQIYAKTASGDLVGGIVAKTIWEWLEISVLWVEDSLRGHGLGSELLRRAETEAIQRGCRYARLSTWDFQALDFYQRHAYISYGRLDDYPEGHTVHYLRRDLGDAEA